MDVSPLETRPKSVAIVALGPSSHDYFNDRAKKKQPLHVDEVWVCNTAIDVLVADKAFIMDDLAHIESVYPDWANRLKATKLPLITCRAYKEYPTSIAYPLDFVFEAIKDDPFSTTVAYMVGYAIATKVDILYLFGCDFFYPGSSAVEAGAADVAYLLGVAKGTGTTYRIPQSSTLLNCHLAKADEKGRMSRPLYGYDYNPGESLERVKNGKGTKLDHLVAPFAPKHMIEKEIKSPEQPYPAGETPRPDGDGRSPKIGTEAQGEAHGA